ncbi:hypothetical protein BKA57DRAFT_441758 [Linnemannia elongata]|nr:hypothetical protein BKA57DRAFT_441758 [Linnemannia elongata]
MHLVRRLSLLNEWSMSSKERTSLQQALSHHQHISCLEVFEETLLHHRLSEFYAESLSELILTGCGDGVGIAMVVFVENLHNLRYLELAQYKFTRKDWERLVTEKPRLGKLVVLQKSVYIEGGAAVSGLSRNRQPNRGEDIVMEDAADIPSSQDRRLHELDPHCRRAMESGTVFKDVGPQTPNTVFFSWRRDVGKSYCGACYDLLNISEAVLTKTVYKRLL